MNGSIIREAESILALRREAALRAAGARSAEVYKAIPLLSEMDRRINLAGNIRAFVVNGVKIPARTREKAEKICPELLSMDVPSLDAFIEGAKNYRNSAILKGGYDLSFDKPDFTCSACKDTGFLADGTRCTCFRRIITDKLAESSNLPCETARFDMFDISAYPEASRAHMQNVLDRAKAFTEDFGSGKAPNLLFVGNSGVGKTFLAECIANSLMSRGVPVLYMPVSMLYEKLSRIHFTSGEEQETLCSFKDTVLNVELLIIDDFGTEKMTETRYEELLEILNTREINNTRRPVRTIITTNLTPQKIFDVYGERIASRLLGYYDILKFEGDDIRLRNKFSKA